MTDTFADLSGQFAEILGATDDLLDGYLSFMALYDAIIVSAFVILALHKVRGEETSGRAEPLLATTTGRVRWLARTCWSSVPPRRRSSSRRASPSASARPSVPARSDRWRS